MSYAIRREDRYDVQLAAALHDGTGSADAVRITNLSSHGCRFTMPRATRLGKLITIAVGRVGRLDAQVRWRVGRTYGVRFDDRIPEVWLDHMRLFLSEAPALVAERAPAAG
jgi:hypothetical protein